MRTDCELLELAAKAAEIEYGWQHIFDDYEGSTSEKWDWNPLTDDGDALRLAVKLGIDILHRFAGDQRVEALAPGGPLLCQLCDAESRQSATRRVIVRAAAEIGAQA